MNPALILRLLSELMNNIVQLEAKVAELTEQLEQK